MAEVKVMYKGQERAIDQDFMEDRPLSPSLAKFFRKSPKHYVQQIITPIKETPAMRMGKLVETLAGITRKGFDEKFMIYEKATGKGSQAKNDKAKAKAMEEKKSLITPEEYETAKKAKDALYAHEMASQLLKNRTQSQVRLSWRDKTNDIPCLGYVDFETKVWDELFAVDLKVMADGDPADFGRLSYFRDLVVQCGAYLDGYHKAKYKFPYFIFLVVEPEPPFNVAVNFVDSKTANYCREEWHGTLKAFKYCLDNQQFDKGYDFRLFDGMDYFSMRLPNYAKSLYGNFSTEE